MILSRESKQKHERLLDYAAPHKLHGYSGISSEDNILITADGNRVLGKSISKSVADAEAAVRR